MTDGFKMELPREVDTRLEWKKKNNKERLRESTKKYCRLNKQVIKASYGSKEGSVANLMGTSTGVKAVVAVVKRKGGHIAVPASVLQEACNHEVPLIIYLEGISKHVEWRFYRYDPVEIITHKDSHKEGDWVWFSIRLGVAYRSEL